MARRVYTLTNVKNSLIINDLGFEARSVAISNYSQFPIYVNVGSESTPSKISFTDVVPPFSSYVIDPAGLSVYAFAIDNSASPFTIFAYPVVLVFSTGSAAALSSISFIPPSASGYAAKVQSIQTASMIDLWILNDTSGVVAVDTINGSRSAAYIASPTLASVLFQDNSTKVATYNGTTQYVNAFTSSFAGAFNGIEGTVLVWMFLTTAQWADTNFYALFSVFNGTNQIWIQKTGANAARGFYQTNLNFTITPAAAWFPMVMTWSQSNGRARVYINGVQSGSDTAVGSGGWNGSLPTKADLGALDTGTPVDFYPNALAFAALWSKELTAAEVLTISTIP